MPCAMAQAREVLSDRFDALVVIASRGAAPDQAAAIAACISRWLTEEGLAESDLLVLVARFKGPKANAVVLWLGDQSIDRD